MARRLAGMDNENYWKVVTHPPLDLQHNPTARSMWNGKTAFIESALEKPLHWKKPRRIFVCSMGDLFHKTVPGNWIGRVFGVMAACPQHTFILCTKRAERMHDLLHPDVIGPLKGEASQTYWEIVKPTKCAGDFTGLSWPLANVIGMVTAEDQEQWDRRVPWLLKTPFAQRWVSSEPMSSEIETHLGMEIDSNGDSSVGCFTCNVGGILHEHYVNDSMCFRGIDGVIVGGESGPGARPMNPDWVRSVRDQCVATGTAFHFKQWGEWAPINNWRVMCPDGNYGFLPSGEKFIPTKELRIRSCVWDNPQDDDEFSSYRVGKRRAGRVLDGRTWDDVPEVKA